MDKKIIHIITKNGRDFSLYFIKKNVDKATIDPKILVLKTQIIHGTRKQIPTNRSEILLVRSYKPKDNTLRNMKCIARAVEYHITPGKKDKTKGAANKITITASPIFRIAKEILNNRSSFLNILDEKINKRNG